ncbi:hypothetical protein DPMN_134318 [Dreissena polymorpha]|uniref:PLAT domain-containing protein n=2 Tax=Dreissena polymorpha TaxID=45954 RepID=A0A9D4FZN3_DREPO|nr:hypothetical protein DPMN_134318 [Dreissena polymorpha]
MGYDAELSSGMKGSFYLSTSGAAPYCGHEYFVDVVMSDQMAHTYGEFMITLVGTKGHSEPLKFESLMHSLDHGAEEKHVISTHVDIGNVTSVKLQFVKAIDQWYAAPYVKVHSVLVVPVEDTSHRFEFCANDALFIWGQTVAVSSHTGC